MKLLIAFLICFAAFANCELLNRHHTPIKDERSVDVLAGFNAVVRQLAESVRVALNNLQAQTDDWIRKELMEIARAIENSVNNYNEYVMQVQAEWDKLVNGQLRPCLEGIPEAIREVHEETKTRIHECRQNGWSQLAEIREDVEAFRAINQAAADGMREFIQSCANLTNIGDKIKCAVDASRNITSSIRKIRENIANTSAIVSEKIREAVDDTNECIEAERRNGYERIQEIFEEARQCLEDASSDAGTSESPEQTTNAETVKETSTNSGTAD